MHILVIYSSGDYICREGTKEWRVWTMDGCSAHLKLPSVMLDKLHQQRIHILVFPPNMTHELQPCDLWFFSMFSLSMGNHKQQWLMSCSSTIDRNNIGIILERAFVDVSRGIYPDTSNARKLEGQLFNHNDKKKNKHTGIQAARKSFAMAQLWPKSLIPGYEKVKPIVAAEEVQRLETRRAMMGTHGGILDIDMNNVDLAEDGGMTPAEAITMPTFSPSDEDSDMTPTPEEDDDYNWETDVLFGVNVELYTDRYLTHLEENLNRFKEKMQDPITRAIAKDLILLPMTPVFARMLDCVLLNREMGDVKLHQSPKKKGRGKVHRRMVLSGKGAREEKRAKEMEEAVQEETKATKAAQRIIDKEAKIKRKAEAEENKRIAAKIREDKIKLQEEHKKQREEELKELKRYGHTHICTHNDIPLNFTCTDPRETYLHK